MKKTKKYRNDKKQTSELKKCCANCPCRNCLREKSVCCLICNEKKSGAHKNEKIKERHKTWSEIAKVLASIVCAALCVIKQIIEKF